MSSPTITGTITSSAASDSAGAYGLTVPERLAASVSPFQKVVEALGRKLRVAMPGIVQSFNPNAQTVVVQLAVSENVRIEGVPQNIVLKPLLDIPIVLPRAGGFSLTLPVTAGDECLVVFGDMCIDSWWQLGGQQNQVEQRRHDLSDGFAILGCWSQPRLLSSYSTSSAQLRKDDGSVKIDVAAGQVTVTAATVNVTGSSQVNISGSGHTTIEGRNFLTHTHSGVASGGSTSGPVV